MSYESVHVSKISDAQRAPLELRSNGNWNVSLSNPEDSRIAARRDQTTPEMLGTGFTIVDSSHDKTDSNETGSDNANPNSSLEGLSKLLMTLTTMQKSDQFSDLKPIEQALETILKALNDALDVINNKEVPKDVPTTLPKDRKEEAIPKDNTKDTEKDKQEDTEKPERVVRVKDSRALESLKIEKNMTVKLEPGVEYKITKGLKLPEGASIIGDKNNPPTIDYIGPTVNEHGKNNWPACIRVDGKDAIVDGINLECSTMTYGTKGGANGIWANEGADNLKIRNTTAGKIESFIHLNGADNVRIDNCSAEKVNSYFLWNEHGANNTVLTNSRCEDSVTEWTVRAYGDNLSIEDCTIGNKNKPEGPFKGALALYNGSASVKDCTINSGIRIGPLNGPVHGVQYIDPEHPDRLKPGLTDSERRSADILNDEVTKIRATGNKINGWITICQNAKDVVFENNDVHRQTDAQGEFIACAEYKKEYAGFRKPPQGRFVNNRFTGPVDEILHNQPHSQVILGPGNSLNGKWT